MHIRFYVDEDSGNRAVVDALRLRGVDVETAPEVGMVRRDDAEHLDYATAQGRVLYTRNVGDFYRLHTECLSQGEPHAGLVIGRHEFSIGDQLRALLRLVASRSAEEMVNQVEFMSAWLTPRNGANE